MGRHSHQFITDGWSRLTMLISFLLGCILFHRDKFNNNDSVLEELISLFYVDNKFKFKFMSDVSKVSEKYRAFNIELLVNGDYDINKIKTWEKQKSCFQMNLFSRQVLECYKWLGKRKSSHRWICRTYIIMFFMGVCSIPNTCQKVLIGRNHSLIKTFVQRT